MLTPQEVSTRAFAKAMMGGYQMSAVDEFLDELTDDYTALYKENATLKAKMKVLVEKVEEYRATEDSMRATLLTAQKMADSIVRQAEEKRDQLLQEAKEMARVQVKESKREIEAAELRLQKGQQELARFIEASRDLCHQQEEFLDRLPRVEVIPEQPEPPKAVEAESPAPPAPEAVEETVPTPEVKETELPEIPPVAAEPAEYVDPFTVPEEPTRRINLEELKFGRNYSAGEK